MKVTGTWEVAYQDARRFNIVARDQNSITLEDNERWRRHKIILENVADFDNVNSWRDAQWWEFLWLQGQF